MSKKLITDSLRKSNLLLFTSTSIASVESSFSLKQQAFVFKFSVLLSNTIENIPKIDKKKSN